MTYQGSPTTRLRALLDQGCRHEVKRMDQRDPHVHVRFTEAAVREMHRLVDRLAARPAYAHLKEEEP